MKNMKNRVRDFVSSLSPDVQVIIREVILAESAKLHLRRPHGIIEEIKQIIQQEVKQEREN